MPKSQIFLYLCLAFVAGVFIASFYPTTEGDLGFFIYILWVFFVLGCLLVILGTTKVRLLHLKGRTLPLAVCGFCVLAFLFGAWRFIQKNDFVSKGLDDYVGQPINISGIIIYEPAQKEKSQEFIIEEERTKNKVLIRTRKYPGYFYGQKIIAEKLLEIPENFSEDFDYTAYLAKDDIYYVMNFPIVEIIGEPKKDLYYYLFSIKSAFSKNINAVLPEPHASFLSGLILGERRSIPKELIEKFQITGTSHIVALSGYNITIVATSIMQFLAWLSIPFRISFWLAMAAVGLFTLLTGASASVVRATIMGILVLIARKEGRLYSVRNALVFAGAVMIFQNPKILRFDTAFQLSFLATLGLVYASPIFDGYFEKAKTRILWKIQPRFSEERVRPSWKTGPSKKSFLREILVSTFSAQFMVLPLLIYNFGRLSIISPLTNLLVLIAIPATMFFGFLTGSGGFIFQPIAQIFSWFSWLLLEYQISVIEFFARVPLAAVVVLKIPLVLVFIAYVGIGYWFWRRK
ncbi:MAG: hypothetical protein A3G49_01415 [Candidatus Sungbacteria bacterium RIFCSPLOWO2_12_FULL_41_11]|uniref:ComEC/Rec2-related protein domain-containing protein n=1 Tax=Candidatus Sungbacteria bacterium RIFCSPLOWO2_12_FULL_41_11 TaxID=1802286 RepID=A0A1G2LSP5_9BACT|nr:MAG: ComEC/Rec2-related protein [Parcubacteria group bacterium GW2011_GWA2_42_14]OHA13882.1 MAG: hypothetical protein A3G49_01415 [Candidatus Sungbacteria bacterium RIFCSPLOWO2_12_FULL_41_11]